MKKMLLLLMATLLLTAVVSSSGSVTSTAQAVLSQCSDGLDNDGDGKIDYGAVNPDPGCSGWDDNDETNLPQCSDNIDNDGDGKVDYAGIFSDPDCENAADNSEGAGGGTPLPQCNNNFDDDGNGYVDYYGGDPGCTGPTDTTESPAPPPPPPSSAACGNGVDDDGDGKVDYPTDPGCYSSADTDEGNVAQCADGVDNDADGKIDTGNVQVWPSGQYAPADDGCSSPYDDTEYAEYQPPPPSGEEGGEGVETGSGETYTKNTGDSDPASLISFNPLPPSAPNAIWCSRQTDLSFNKGFTFYPGKDIMTYQKPTKFFFRITFRCNKPILANATDWTLQTRRSSTGGAWTIKDLGVDSSGGFGNVTVTGPGWNGQPARQYAYTFLHTWTCKNVAGPPNVLETDYRVTRKETGSAQLYTLSNPPQPIIYNWSPTKSFGVMRITGYVTEQCYP